MAVQLANGTSTSVSTVPIAVPGLGTGVAAISANAGHTCALLDTGSIKCWGDNHDGQLGDGSFVSSASSVGVQGLGAQAVEIGVGQSHSCAFVRGGGLSCWGNNYQGELGSGTVGNSEGGVMESAVPVAVIGFP